MTFITSHLYNPESIDDPRIYFLTLVGRVIAMRELTNVILVGCLSRGCSAVGWGVRNAIETLRISDTSTKQAANLTTTVDPQGSDALDKEICSQLENAFTRMPGNLAAYMTGLQRELRTIAHAQRQKLGSSETLSTTALVNEVYLKLSTSSVRFERVEHTHFLAIAARAMRHIVINYARDRVAQKRGSGVSMETLGDDEQVSEDIVEANQILELNSALERLEDVRPRLAQVVQLRFFAGFSELETASVLDLDASTVRRDWVKARGWLFNQLNPNKAH